jgi:flagellar motor switch protein FliG
MTLPPEMSAQLFNELGPEEVQAITLEITQLPTIAPEVRATVINEFLNSSSMGGGGGGGATMGMGGGMSFGGGGRSTMNMPSMPMGPMGNLNRPFGFLSRVEATTASQLISREHPQTIAVVLSHLEAEQGSSILDNLSPSVQTEVAHRLASLGPVPKEVLRELEKVLENKLQKAIDEGFDSSMDGKDALFKILSNADRGTEESVIFGLTQTSPHLASDIKTKLCDFEDLASIDQTSLAQVLKLVDDRDLVLALKGANKELAERVYRVYGPDKAASIRADVSAVTQVSWEDIRAAQQQIRNILRGLVSLGKIRFK